MQKRPAPADFSEEPYIHIPMQPVKSNQVAAIGYNAASKRLAVTFTRGTGTVYQYPNVEPKLHADFMAAESKGAFFGANVKHLPFQKFPEPASDGLREAEAA